MGKRQLAGLLVLNFIPFLVGNGLLPLLPVYATLLGAGQALAGYVLSLTYLALACGTFSAGWFIRRFRKPRTILLVTSLISLPLWWIFQYIHSLWQLIVLNMLTWYIGGLMTVLLSIIAGLSAKENQRGKIFGLMAFTTPLGTLIAGLFFGRIADAWGFSALFLVITIFQAGIPLASFLLEDEAVPVRNQDPSMETGPDFSPGFFLLLAASLLACTAGFIGIIGISLSMHAQGYSASAISSVSAIAGLIALPLPFLIGWLSDRMGRKVLLSSCFFSGAAALTVLTAANSFALFSLVAILNSIRAYVSSGISQAFVTDLVARHSLSRAMSYYQTSFWAGGILGFAISGVAFQSTGTVITFLAGGLALLIAIGIVSFIQKRAGSETA